MYKPVHRLSPTERRDLKRQMSIVAAKAVGDWLLQNGYDCIITPLERAATNTRKIEIRDVNENGLASALRGREFFLSIKEPL